MRQNVLKFAGLPRPTCFKLAVLLAAAIIGASSGVPRIHGLLARPQGAHWTAEQAARRMLLLCDAYKGPCEMDEMPIYCGDPWAGMPARLCRRTVWAGFVRINGQMLELIMNDRTGNVVCVFHGGEAATTWAPQNAGIETPAQAARLSMLVARKLQMIPPDARVALVGIPKLEEGETVWRITWQVWDKPMVAAYQVKVILQQKDGRLMAAMNRREQELNRPR